MPKIVVPFKDHGQIKKLSHDFLKRYHPADTYPVPIEEIIEFKLKLDIIPLPGLHKAFEVDGFLAADRKSISVDEGVYQSRPGRYRFTLAHEVGHFILHKALYDQHVSRDTKEWKEFVSRFPEKEYAWFEWQAYEFAGLVLVPGHHLKRRLEYHLRQLKEIGIRNDSVAVHRAADLIARDFLVSPEVVRRRITREVATPCTSSRA